jgi:hypothetical protein
LLREDGDMVVWWGTAVECHSALARLERGGELIPAGPGAAERALAALREGWSQVVATEVVRGHAMRLLHLHPFRSTDALQAAAALTWSAGPAAGLEVVTLDERLGAALAREGFRVLPGP